MAEPKNIFAEPLGSAEPRLKSSMQRLWLYCAIIFFMKKVKIVKKKKKICFTFSPSRCIFRFFEVRIGCAGLSIWKKTDQKKEWWYQELRFHRRLAKKGLKVRTFKFNNSNNINDIKSFVFIIGWLKKDKSQNECFIFNSLMSTKVKTYKANCRTNNNNNNKSWWYLHLHVFSWYVDLKA
jgi:hypothetical protein